MLLKPLSPLEIFTFFFVLVPFATPTSLENTTFKLDSFNPNMHDIIYEGHANLSNQVIQLNKNQPNSSGRATYGAPMHLWEKASGNLADFTTHFVFCIDSQNKDPYGDGLTFFLAPNGSQLPPYSAGGYLGLVSSEETSDSPKFPFVAVEFDTFHNPWDTSQSNHVGIDLNSLFSVTTLTWLWSDIQNGKKVEAWISYNSTSKNVTVRLTDGDNKFSSSMYSIVDLKDYLPEWVTFGFSASTGDAFEMHNIHSWEFSSSLKVAENNQPSPPPVAPNPEIRRKGKSWRWMWFIAGVGALLLVSLVPALVWYWCRVKRSRKQSALLLAKEDPPESIDEEIEMVKGPRKFSFDELVTATGNFSSGQLLGKGGFAMVYHGILCGMDFAVKRITMESREREDVMKEYASEVNTISQLSHKNLVRLIGWCNEKGEFLIVYEFMPNNSLDYHLFKAPTVLTWETRHQIALALAQALRYLQEDCRPWVLHRDIKSNNILLDSDFNAKLGDFGLARLVETGQGSRTTTLIGTEGYVAPEYLETKRPTKESDVYSFGVVALEIACGKRAIELVQENGRRVEKVLVKEVWKQYGGNNVLGAAADPRLQGGYDTEQMKRLIVVGLLCAHPIHNNRPSIVEAINMLNSTIPLPELPFEMPARGYVAPPAIYEAAMRDASSERV